MNTYKKYTIEELLLDDYFISSTLCRLNTQSEISFRRGSNLRRPRLWLLKHSRFVDMTRPARPQSYNEFPKQDTRPTVLPTTFRHACG